MNCYETGTTTLKLFSVTVFVLSAALLQSCNNPSTDSSQSSASQAGRTSGSAALKAYKDPVTGKFGGPTAGTRIVLPSAARNNRKSTVSVMKEVPGPVTGGGIMVNLKGQFRKNLMATKDAKGNITTMHAPGTATTSAKDN